jgi:hypothetical protein
MAREYWPENTDRWINTRISVMPCKVEVTIRRWRFLPALILRCSRFERVRLPFPMFLA